MSTTEGREVRQAYDGPDLDHDALISHIEARIREEHARQSDASESSAKTSDFVEDTGVNSQALAWMKSILKKLPKKDGQHKAMDVIRSLEAGLPMIKAHVEGQGTGEMQLEPDPESDEDDPQTAEVGPHVEEEDAETAEFNEAVDEATEDEVVTPISLGAAG